MDARTAHALGSEVTFVDVREAYEFEAGTVPGAVHLPIGRVETDYRDLPVDRPLVIMCQIGQRSALVVDFLTGRGLEAHDLEGGLEAWQRAGLPLAAAGGGPGRIVDGWARDLSGRRINRP